MTAYYVHIDFGTPAGAVASFDGMVEAPNLKGAVLQAEERAGSVAKSIGAHSTTCQALPDDGALKKVPPHDPTVAVPRRETSGVVW